MKHKQSLCTQADSLTAHKRYNFRDIFAFWALYDLYQWIQHIRNVFTVTISDMKWNIMVFLYLYVVEQFSPMHATSDTITFKQRHHKNAAVLFWWSLFLCLQTVSGTSRSNTLTTKSWLCFSGEEAYSHACILMGPSVTKTKKWRGIQNYFVSERTVQPAWLHCSSKNGFVGHSRHGMGFFQFFHVNTCATSPVTVSTFVCPASTMITEHPLSTVQWEKAWWPVVKEDTATYTIWKSV